MLDTIYNDVETYFPKKNKTVKFLGEVVTKQVEVPPRETLENFFFIYINQI